MYLKGALLLVLSSISYSCLARSPTENFEELLTVRPLRDGRVATRFSFTMSQADVSPHAPRTDFRNSCEPQHYSLFPLSLGQVLKEYAVTEVHLSLNAGKWNYGRWGYPEDPAVATGAELWAWMGDSESASVDDRWKGLRNALSGLFCASIGSLDELRTTSPAYAFSPEGMLPRLSPNESHRLRHASLPSEHVCTENLTPFLKLLPCKSSAGIARLLNPHRLFDADWHGMGIHVTWSEKDGVTLQLSFQAVLDPVRLSTLKKRDFSLRSLFDRTITKACPVATDSKIEVTLPQDVMYSITPEPSILHGQVGIFDVTAVRDQPLDISIHFPKEDSFSYPLDVPRSPLTDFEVSRTLTGTTQSHGRLSVSIKNNRPYEMQLVYVETMPWLVTFFLHTLELTVDGRKSNGLMARMAYTPPEAHGRPTLFEARLTLPAASTLQLSMDVSKSFLRYAEHPPDAQRGWDLPSAVLVPVAAHEANVSAQRVYTPAVLVDLATPDFSMPYNVIIMSSTLIALIFGSIFNLLTRRFVAVKINDDVGESVKTMVGAKVE
ncbi:GPI transamidase component GPI16 [Phellopilus nigrolimitatus]|nr:GPI transamidase component GPI16 [Phellopilus nigrolimitatus]